MIKRIIGWILFLAGLAGIVANLAFVIATSTSTWTLVINTLFCLVFIFGGWRLAHPADKTYGRLKR